MPLLSIHTLLEQSIDYAGMFPPCSLGLEQAIGNQAEYARAPDAWMLGSFVLSTGKFDAIRQLLAQFDEQHPLRIAALGPKTEGPDDFLKGLQEAHAAILSVSRDNVGPVSTTHLEMFLPDGIDVSLLNDAKSIIGDLPVFWETPAQRAEQAIALLAAFNSDANSPPFGFKLRTGGVIADAFPTSPQIAKVLVSPTTHRLPIKFTAGLHHPLRQYREEVQAKMHGFLNVLGAAVLAAEHQWDADQAAIMLEDENAESFLFTDDFFMWREWQIDIKRLRNRRRFVVSFGSCSFDEPRDDLRSLNLL
ncbi:MAG TPA: hypothetical protein VFQ83_03990 [Candidatus Udaeobacter sp.]|jgi:hypothetical protein|nr:hypothetical protein [Candidatus Udaeobacter sp.]